MKLPLEKLIEHEAAYLGLASAAEKTACAWYIHRPEVPEWQDANRALRLRDDGRGPDIAACEIVETMRGRGMRPTADVDSIAEAQGLGIALRRLGLMPVTKSWLLMRHAVDAALALPERGIEVRSVARESEEAQEWVEVVMSDEDEPETAATWRAVAEMEANYPPCRLVLAYMDGRAVGACDLFSQDGWGRIDSVVVRPEVRRRGVALAMVARAVTESKSLGNDVTYLTTEGGGAGEQVYLRLGFETWGVNVMHRHLA